jgi:hypothetical protein
MNPSMASPSLLVLWHPGYVMLLCATAQCRNCCNDDGFTQLIFFIYIRHSSFLLIRTLQCGEACDAMQETWSRLSDDWKDHAIGLVAQVDCSDLNEHDNEADHNAEYLNPICEEYGIDTFPTVIYGDPASPELYPHDNVDELTNYDALSTFCQATISQPTCSFQRLSYCSETQRAILQDLLTKTRGELEAMEVHVEELLQQQQDKYEQGLQSIKN